MAGELSIQLVNQAHNPPPISVIKAEWQVQYARFISNRSADYPSTHPSLVHLPVSVRFRRGNWISTASHSATLKLVYERSTTGSDQALLSITIPPWVPEEHCVCKMHFSWPQVSCLSGYPARGSRAVFVSYKDHEGQIQKFAMYFVAFSDAEKFINILKEIMGDGGENLLQCSEVNSELSSQAEVVPPHKPTDRPEGDWQLSEDNSIHPIAPNTNCDAFQEFESHEMQQMLQDPETADRIPAFIQPIIPSTNVDASQESQSHEMQQLPQDPEFAEPVPAFFQPIVPSNNWDASQEFQSHGMQQISQFTEAAESMPDFPPSFTELLKSCRPVVDVKPKDSQENLKTQFLRYLEGVSVEEMLTTVQNVISEMGDDLILF